MTYLVGKGLLVKYNGTTIGQVVKCKPPQEEMNTAESTNFASTAEEFVATLLNEGECTFTVEWDPANSTHINMRTAFRAGTLSAFSIVFTDVGNATISFNAIIQKYPWNEITPKEIIMADLTLRLSGIITGP